MFDVVMLINGLGTWPVNNKQVAEDTHPPNSFFVSLVFTWGFAVFRCAFVRAAARVSLKVD
jgi:hypothetical protein